MENVDNVIFFARKVMITSKELGCTISFFLFLFLFCCFHFAFSCPRTEQRLGWMLGAFFVFVWFSLGVAGRESVLYF